MATQSKSSLFKAWEVTCEANYMEVRLDAPGGFFFFHWLMVFHSQVSIKSDVTCTSQMYKDDWNSLKTAHSSTTSDWQVMFQQGEQKHSPMTLSQAAKQGYAFFLTSGRLVFRTPYGQPHSLNTEVNGVPVEVVYVTMYSRQSWVVLMIDLVAACSMDEGSPDGDHMVWRTLDPLYPSLSIVDVSVGLNGQLLEQPAAEKRGYTVQKHDSRLQISVPFDADGRYRKSFVNGSLFDFYVFHVYSEQILLSQDQVETRLRLHRTMTAVVQRPLLTENRTILEEEVFTAYLGKLPEDVVLAAVTLNGEEYTLPLANTSSHTITKVTYADNTQGYTLRVPFEHPVVGKKVNHSPSRTSRS
ncbi:unnamed protein product [Tetraodon nigroviridis]|uniref:(spotted green pufferfish) hypothetical protein n=1 Tax=Tetraodon nigroviridis TaxID=99883 RepID=Q4TC02_TETNG|nr:unnamed protein product [Tetraodon nigroviridis]